MEVRFVERALGGAAVLRHDFGNGISRRVHRFLWGEHGQGPVLVSGARRDRAGADLRLHSAAVQQLADHAYAQHSVPEFLARPRSAWNVHLQRSVLLVWALVESNQHSAVSHCTLSMPTKLFWRAKDCAG